MNAGQTSHYQRLEKIFQRINFLDEAKAILHWDSAVMMPEGGAAGRAEQLATLEGVTHQLLTSREVRDLIEGAQGETHHLDQWQKANLQEIARLVTHATAVPEDLQMALTKASSECEMVWRSARGDDDFQRFLPSFKQVLQLVREMSDIKANQFHCSRYDALLDMYDPGRKSAEIDGIFGQLEAFLPDFIQTVQDKQRRQDPPLPIKGHFPIDKQKQLGLQCMKSMGFDFQRGRLDVSHHPFCGGNPGDVRITTRYDERDFLPALMGVIHETGHALYENNLPSAYFQWPVGKARGMSFHESQSLFMEMQVASRREFLTWIQPKILETFQVQGPQFSVENFYRTINHVSPSLIRVDADEVTYPAHILLRYKLEKEMIAGHLEAQDLPGAWREGMKKYLGIEVPNDKDGCMQDIHWPSGSIGYFPTYTLGAMLAAQLFSAMEKDLPQVHTYIQRGEFAPLVNWLREKVHSQGSKLSSPELVMAATGHPLDISFYKNYLQNKYLG